jgi:KaiC/GvpD/RAD55 family RecA-like ATPase
MSTTPSTTPSADRATGFSPLDALLGGSLPRGAAVLVFGGSGVGKSTLLEHIAIASRTRALYVACDELPANVVRRARRLQGAEDVPADFAAVPASTLAVAVRAIGNTRIGSIVLVDGAQELGRYPRDVLRTLRDAARTSAAIVFASFQRASEEARAEADIVLGIYLGQGPAARRLCCLKNRYAATTGNTSLRMTSAGLVPVEVAR